MQITGNTMLITGGTSGIGRALAEAFYKLGNQVIVAGRRRALLDAVSAANPGMVSAVLDVQDLAGLDGFAERIVRTHPSLNVLINNAGIMKLENLREAGDTSAVATTVTTNLLAPLRLTTALLPHLQQQPHAAVMTVSSGLAFVPLVIAPTYCATKAAIHSWTQSLRWQLRGTSVEVLEVIPPYVQTELMSPRQEQDQRAMPLADFIAQAVQILRTEPSVQEVCVRRVDPLRYAGGLDRAKYDQVFQGLNSGAGDTHER